MIECINIPQWILAVIGFILLIISAYCFSKGYCSDSDPKCRGPFVAMAVAFGIVLLLTGSSPYIPDLSHLFVMPCIQVTP